jgi:hypothetical protein
MKSAREIREDLIIAKALAYAILTIESLPPRWQEWSDKEDMKVLLERAEVFKDFVMSEAKHHLDGAKHGESRHAPTQEEKANDNG